jgi:hypothetical protein
MTRLFATPSSRSAFRASAVAVIASVGAVVFATAAGSAASPLAKRGPALQSKVSITSISPTQEFRGDAVAITGNGFGGPNVRVTVGGVAAQVVSATGSSATFVVPNGAPLGQTTVRATNPGGQFGEIGFIVLFDGKVTPVLDQPDAVQMQIGPQGGTITTSGGITLQIPAGALHDTQTITLTPLSAVQGSPLASLLGGVQLDPQGLHFLVPATLSVPLPGGVDPHQLVGFGFDGGGISFHLKPPVISGGTMSLQITHFSGGGAGTLTPAQSASILGYQPTPADEAAEQEIAAALQLYEQQGTDPDPAIDAALSTWYRHLKVGLQSVGDSIDFYELAVGEWQAWLGEVQAWSDTSRHAAENTQAADLATNDASHLADLALSACDGSGSDPLAALKPVIRLASDLETVPLQIETQKDSNGKQLPPADGLDSACVHVQIKSVDHPPVLAFALAKNTVTAAVEVDFWTGTSRTDSPVAVDLYDVTDGPKSSVASDTTSNGSSSFTFAAGPKPHRKYAVIANLPGDPSLHDPTSVGALGEEKDFDLDVRDRVELHSNATVAPGGTVSLQALLAGDGMANATVGFSNSGAGTLSASTGTTDTSGATTVDYTASNDPAGGTDTITASFDDGTGTVTAQVTITISAGTCSGNLSSFRLDAIAPLSQSDACSSVDVSIQPTTVTLATGQGTTFTATVTGTSDQTVTWTATGGTIDQNGTYTAGPTTGTYTVTATSNADSNAHDAATVTILQDEGVTRVSSRGRLGIGCDDTGPPEAISPDGATSWQGAPPECSSDIVLADGNGNVECEYGSDTSGNLSFQEAYASNGDLLSAHTTGSISADAWGTIDQQTGQQCLGSGGGVADYNVTFSVAHDGTKVTVQGSDSGSGHAGADVRITCLQFNCIVPYIAPHQGSFTQTLTLDAGTYRFDCHLTSDTTQIIGDTSCDAEIRFG